MKKIIEIDDKLFKKLEKIQKDYSINSLTPVISLVLTLGVNWFRKLEGIAPTVCNPPQYPSIDWWTYPYQGTGAAKSDDVTIKWNVINAISGCIDNDK